ncbi:MAG: biotin transporter BioY [Anaerolineales bacterium]
MTVADIFRPAARRAARTYDVALVLGASAVVALCSQVEFHLPGNPVPITGQTFAVLLAGALLGPRLGALAMLAYLTQGALGLPVFAGGAGGAARLLGPTGGYLIGFVAAAALVGWLAERGWDRTPWLTAGAMFLGNLVIYALGVTRLAAFVGSDQAVALGVLPFLPGDLIKVALATGLLPSAWKLLGGRRPAMP